MSNANQVLLLAHTEATYGEDPDDDGPETNWDVVRFTSESLQLEANNIQSTEIVNTRQVSDLVRVSARAAGDINGELSSRTYDKFFESGMYGTWTTKVADVSVNYTIGTPTGKVATITAATGTPFTSTDVQVGNLLVLSGFVNAVNNDVVRVVSRDSNTQVTAVWLKNTPVAEGPEAATVGYFSKLANGTTQKSFTIQRNYEDLDSPQVSTIFKGLIVDGMNLQVAVDNIVSISFSFLGSTQTSATTTKDFSTGLNTTSQVLNTVDHVYGVAQSADYTAAINFQITGMNIQTSNNLAERRIVGQFAAHSIRAGVFQVTGGITALFEANTIVDQFLNGSRRNATVIFTDPATGDYLAFDVLSIRYSQAPAVASGQNQDVVLDLQFQGLRQATIGTTMQIHRYPL